jgi:cysteine desulfurase
MSVAVIARDARRKSLQANCIYLDHAANSELDPRVLETMHRVLADKTLGNAHAAHHPYGSAAARVVQGARHQVASLIGAHEREIIFTSGATEANNLLIKGLADYLRRAGKTHIITSAVEHKSVLEPFAKLHAEGFSVSILPVKPCGMIESHMIEPALQPNTGLVCVQSVNNETGTIQPISEMAFMLKGRNVLLHTDAAQALGKIDFNVVAAGVDFATLSAHKVHGPQGIGALYARSEKAEFLQALMLGGGQQSGLRAGTIPTALCAGFGEACAVVYNNRHRLQAMRSHFLRRLASLKPVVHGHSEAAWNVPGIINLRFPGIESETLVMALPGLAFGLASACSSSGTALSHVIKAMTNSDQAARECIRISFSHYTAIEDLDEAANQILDAVTNIRQIQGVT